MTHRGSKFIKRLLTAVLALCLAVAIGVSAYAGDYYHTAPTTTLLEQYLVAGNSDEPSFAENDARIAVGSPTSAYGLVFYPGAKVEASANLPLAYRLAREGVYCVIAKMPLNLAILNVDAAQAIMDEAPEVGTWWVGGHSLGGAMAAQFASKHADALAGVVLLGAYSQADLSDTRLRIMQAYGSEDHVLNRDKLAANAANLPDGTEPQVIEGGNHAGFGDYGLQDGDGTASISASEQQDQACSLILGAMMAR